MSLCNLFVQFPPGIKDLQQEMTIEQMDAEIDVLEKEIARDKLSVAALQGGVNLVSDEERIQVENDLFKYSVCLF